MSDGHECPTCGQWVEPELTPEQRERMLSNLRAYAGPFTPTGDDIRPVTAWRDALRRLAPRFPSERDSDEPVATS